MPRYSQKSRVRKAAEGTGIAALVVGAAAGMYFAKQYYDDQIKQALDDQIKQALARQLAIDDAARYAARPNLLARAEAIQDEAAKKLAVQQLPSAVPTLLPPHMLTG